MPALYPEWDAGSPTAARGAADRRDGGAAVPLPVPHQSGRVGAGERPALWVAINRGERRDHRRPHPGARGWSTSTGGTTWTAGRRTYLCKRTGEAGGRQGRAQYLPHELVGAVF